MLSRRITGIVLGAAAAALVVSGVSPAAATEQAPDEAGLPVAKDGVRVKGWDPNEQIVPEERVSEAIKVLADGRPVKRPVVLQRKTASGGWSKVWKRSTNRKGQLEVKFAASDKPGAKYRLRLPGSKTTPTVVTPTQKVSTKGLIQVTGSMETADGYAWRSGPIGGWLGIVYTAAASGTTVVANMSEEGTFNFYMPADAEVSFRIGQEGFDGTFLHQAPPWFNPNAEDVWQPTHATFIADGNPVNIRTPRANRVTVLVKDKDGSDVRNAAVVPKETGYFADAPTDFFPMPTYEGSCGEAACEVTPFDLPYPFGTPAYSGEGSDRGPVSVGDVTGVSGVEGMGGYVPFLAGGYTDSYGRSVVATPGEPGLSPEDAIADVYSALTPYQVQSATALVKNIVPVDPNLGVVVAQLPYLPIMQDSSSTSASSGDISAASVTTPAVTVTNPDGTPIAGAAVGLVQVLPGDSETSPKESTVQATAYTDSNGQAQFNNVPSGTWRVIPETLSTRTVDFTVEHPANPNDPGTNPNDPGIDPSPSQPTTKPGKVTDLKVQWQKKKRKAVVKWEAPVSNNADKYQVRISKPDKLKKFNKWKNTKDLKYVYKDLKMKKEYKVQVRAKNNVGTGDKKGKKFKTKK